MKSKKLLCGLTCAALLAAPGAVLADAPDVNLIVNQAHVYGDEATGQPYVNDQYRTMLPLRIINDTLGYDTEWQKDGQIRITDKDKKVDVTLKIGSTDYTANGEAGKFETALTTKNNRTYLPAHHLIQLCWNAQSMGFNTLASSAAMISLNRCHSSATMALHWNTSLTYMVPHPFM